MRFEVETGPNGLRSLFKLAGVDKNRVKLKPMNRKDGFSFELEGEDAENFKNIIQNSGVSHKIEG